MNSRNIFVYAVILAGFAVAFTIGRVTAPHAERIGKVNALTEEGNEPHPDVPALPVASRNGIKIPEDTPASTGLPVRTLTVKSMSEASSSPVLNEPVHSKPDKKFSQQELMTSLQDTDPVRAAVSFAAALEAIDASNIRQAIDVFESMPNLISHQHEYSLLLYKWATIDGPAAIAHVEAMEKSWQRMRYSYEILSGWAATDPDMALDWATAQHEGSDNPYLPGVISGLARRDIDKATELLYTMPYGQNRGRAVSAVVDAYMRIGADEAKRWAESVEDETLKKGIIPRVAYRCALENPEDAATWQLSVTSDQDKKSVLSQITRYWSFSQPEEAAHWVTQIKDEDLRSHGMESVSRSWARRDPVAAMDWIKKQEASPYKDRAIVGLSDSIKRTNPEYALEWAGRISDKELKKETVGNIFQDWMRRDPEKARAYLDAPE